VVRLDLALRRLVVQAVRLELAVRRLMVRQLVVRAGR
jgi:hypothetical protein